jgi:4-diphosphocytidyl-2-C-methyl-D-erythritol kinase
LKNALAVRAHAKVNLTLDVVARRADGYHSIESLVLRVGLHDTVSVKKASSGVTLTDPGGTPAGPENLACRAAAALLRYFPAISGVEISLEKAIPMAAGLAGGSADAAAVIKAIVDLWNLPVSPREMSLIGETVGSDIPFCLSGLTCALATGKGEVLTPLRPATPLWLLLACPPGEVSARWAYEAWDHGSKSERPCTNACIQALECGDLETLGLNLGNALEMAVAGILPSVPRLRDAMMQEGALGACMSGSGPCVFGIFRTSGAAEEARVRIEEHETLRYIGVSRSL